MNDRVPLYNSRIIKVFTEYVRKFYPEVDIDTVTENAGITAYAVEDQAHWFNQNQVDRFTEALVEKTGNPNIAREAGRYTVSAEALGVINRYLLGLRSLRSFYLSMEKLYPIMSQGASVKAKKLGPNRVEVIATPKPGVNEKPYQCENRIGIFESVAKLFTGKLATIKHPSCFHKGDDCCQYVITWEKTPVTTWKQIRNYWILLSTLFSLALFFFLPIESWVFLVLMCGFLTMVFSCYAIHLEKKDLAKTVEAQGNVSKDHLEEMNIRYNNALLGQEIGQATSTILDIDDLLKSVMNTMEKRLDFDRGMIMLASREKARLLYAAGYGYIKEQEELLKRTEFHLDNPESKGVFVLAFKERKSFLLNGIAEIERDLSKRSLEFVREMNVQSFICVPIVYEKESLGVLAVDNIDPRRPLTQSDMNLLTGIASQTAVSIVNARSFQELQESEKKYRELVENANSIILRMDTDGNITFFNEFAQRFFGYAGNEILGGNVKGTILPDSESTKHVLEDLVKSLQQEPERQGVRESENIHRNGTPMRIAWTYKPIFDSDGHFREILCIGSDISEKKRLEAQLLHAQKMEAIGTLAGGIAHDFNNVLQAISGYTQIMLMEKNSNDPDYKKLEAIERSSQRASDLTRRLLIFGRKVESKLKPVDLNHEVVQVSKMLERTIPKMINIELCLAENLKITNADPVQIEQIMMNMGVNARDAMPDGGKLIFKTESVILDEAYCKSHLGSNPGEYVLLSVSDTGQGIDDEIMEHIFEPFFTTKETGKGTGLGLAMVYGIVKSHGGYITCESEQGQGATFKIYFPAIGLENKVTEPKETEVPIIGGNETVLLVDDENSICELGKETLSRVGYKVLTAPDGESALELYSKASRQVDLVILDLIMPGMGGKRCLDGLLELNPHAKVLISSGYSINGATSEALQAGAKGFIAKPYEIKQMLKLVREVLDRD